MCLLGGQKLQAGIKSLPAMGGLSWTNQTCRSVPREQTLSMKRQGTYVMIRIVRTRPPSVVVQPHLFPLFWAGKVPEDTAPKPSDFLLSSLFCFRVIVLPQLRELSNIFVLASRLKLVWSSKPRSCRDHSLSFLRQRFLLSLAWREGREFDCLIIFAGSTDFGQLLLPTFRFENLWILVNNGRTFTPRKMQSVRFLLAFCQGFGSDSSRPHRSRTVPLQKVSESFIRDRHSRLAAGPGWRRFWPTWSLTKPFLCVCVCVTMKKNVPDRWQARQATPAIFRKAAASTTQTQRNYNNLESVCCLSIFNSSDFSTPFARHSLPIWSPTQDILTFTFCLCLLTAVLFFFFFFLSPL